MIRFKIENLHPYNGEFPLDLERGFTNRELHTIKEVAGVRANEVEEAFNAGDNDMLVALAVIALRRAGLAIHMDALWDADAGAIQVLADVEDDADPPDLTPPAESGSGAEQNEFSGNSSNGGGDLPVSPPSPTGSHLSERSAT